VTHPIGPTLLDAATSRCGVPVVLLDVQDRQTRWQSHCVVGAASTQHTDMVGVGGRVHRALLQGSEVLYALVDSPDAPEAWPGAWEVVADDADGDADVAIAAYAGALSIFYRDRAGWLSRVDSADGGLTWSVPTRCCAWDYATRVAAAGAVCIWSRPGEVHVAITRDDLGQPAWFPAGTYDGAGTFGQCGGLALCADHASPQHYYLVCALDGALYVASFHEPSRTFGATHRMLPPGSAGTPSTSQVHDPSAVSAADGLYVSCVDRVGAGDLAHWEQPIVLHTPQYPHASRSAVVDMGQSAAARPSLATDGEHLYLAYQNAVCRAALPTGAAAAHDLSGLCPSAYTVRADAHGSRLTVWLPNANGSFDALGDPCGLCASLRPWSRMVLQRGYRTVAGAEAVALTPHYVEAARLEYHRGGSTLRLEAVDGRGLLARWRSPDVCTWEGEAIRALLGQVAGLVGLACADAGEPELAATLARCVLQSGQTAWSVVCDLLTLAGAVAYCDESGTVQVRVLARHAPEPVSIGAAGEILGWSRCVEAGPHNAARVYGDRTAAASPPSVTSMESGIALYRSIVDYRATTAALAEGLAAHHDLLARMSARRELVDVPLRPDIELWDRATLPPEHHAPDSGFWRVMGVVEEYDAAQGVYRSRLELGRQHAPGE